MRLLHEFHGRDRFWVTMVRSRTVTCRPHVRLDNSWTQNLPWSVSQSSCAHPRHAASERSLKPRGNDHFPTDVETDEKRATFREGMLSEGPRVCASLSEHNVNTSLQINFAKLWEQKKNGATSPILDRFPRKWRGRAPTNQATTELLRACSWRQPVSFQRP